MNASTDTTNNIDREGSSFSANGLVASLFDQVRAAPADAAIQSIAEESIVDHVSMPIDLFELEHVLMSADSARTLREMLAEVIQIQLKALRANTEVAKTLDDAQLPKGKPKETVYDCLSRNIDEVRRGKTVTEVVKQAVDEAHDFSELEKLFKREDIEAWLTRSLLIAAHDKISEIYIERFSNGENRDQLISFARSLAETLGTGHAVQMLLAYKIPFEEAYSLVVSTRGNINEKREVLRSLSADRNAVKAHFSAEIVEGFDRIDTHVPVRTFVNHLGTEAFQYGGLGIDELCVLLGDTDAVAALHRRVKAIALDTLLYEEDPLNGHSQHRLSPRDQDNIKTGKTMVSTLLEDRGRRLGEERARATLPPLKQFTEALVSAAVFQARAVYQSLLEEQGEDGEPNRVIVTLGMRIAECIIDGQEPGCVLFQALDDLERCGILSDDAYEILSTAMISAGHNYSPEQIRLMVAPEKMRVYEEDAARMLEMNPHLARGGMRLEVIGTGAGGDAQNLGSTDLDAV